MKEFVNVIECGFAALGGYLGWAMGGFDGFLYALVVFVAVDYVTGLMAAAVEKKWYCGHYHTEKKVDKLEIMFENFREL